jgi:hypothetical protein
VLPKITKALPPSLVGLVVSSLVAIGMKLPVREIELCCVCVCVCVCESHVGGGGEREEEEEEVCECVYVRGSVCVRALMYVCIFDSLLWLSYLPFSLSPAILSILFLSPYQHCQSS